MGDQWAVVWRPQRIVREHEWTKCRIRQVRDKTMEMFKAGLGSINILPSFEHPIGGLDSTDEQPKRLMVTLKLPQRRSCPGDSCWSRIPQILAIVERKQWQLPFCSLPRATRGDEANTCTKALWSKRKKNWTFSWEVCQGTLSSLTGLGQRWTGCLRGLNTCALQTSSERLGKQFS